MSGTGSDNGWLEAAVAWEVCASLHRQYCKGKDALFTTRQSDFVKHAVNARGRASHGQAPAGAVLPAGWVPLTITHEGQYPEEVAYGPQIMMDRLGKWLGKYFARAAQEDSVLEDAARYRHLRDCNSGSLAVMQITGTDEDDWFILTEDDADAAIDAARKQGGAT